MWSIRGSYLASCSCTERTHPHLDGSLSHARAGCNAAIVFWIEVGHFKDVDLTHTAFSMYSFIPLDLFDAIWEMGLVVDDNASDDQAIAIEQIAAGHEGGRFEALVRFGADFLGLERAPISFTSTPTALVEGRSSFTFHPERDTGGVPATAKSAMLSFNDGFVIGRTEGHHHAFGHQWEPSYGEHALYLTGGAGPEHSHI